MSTLSLRLLDSLHEEIKALAKAEGMSMKRFISSAVSEKMSALLTERYLLKRASYGNEKSFFDAMSKIPDVEPDTEDRIK